MLRRIENPPVYYPSSSPGSIEKVSGRSAATDTSRMPPRLAKPQCSWSGVQTWLPELSALPTSLDYPSTGAVLESGGDKPSTQLCSSITARNKRYPLEIE